VQNDEEVNCERQCSINLFVPTKVLRTNTTTKVVKITFWLVKSYDFTSQNMHYGLNRLKKSKMDKIGLKSSEIVKIGWNRAKSRFQDRFCDFDKMRPWNKILPSWTAVRCLLDYSCTVVFKITWLSSLCSFQLRRKTLSQITIHKYSFQFQQNKSLIGRRQRSILHPPQKRSLRKLLPLILHPKKKERKRQRETGRKRGAWWIYRDRRIRGLKV